METTPVPMLTLRPYQARAIDLIRRCGSRRVLLVQPTGTGKTVVYLDIAQRAITKGNRVLILAHQRELIEQPSRKLDALGVAHGIIQAGNPRRNDAPIQIATPQTLHRRRLRPPADVLIIDEAHLFLAKTFRAILDDYPDAYIIGLTATPCRLDGRGLGELFERIVEPITIAQAIPEYLVPIRTFAPDHPDLSRVHTIAGEYKPDELGDAMDTHALVGNIVEQWQSRAAGRPTLVFATLIRHSLSIVQRFRAAGIEARHIDGTTRDRGELLRWVARGGVLVNAQLLTFGVDVPEISCIVQARPTQSLTVHLQQIGRGTRLSPGKLDLIVLDHADNYRRHGLATDPQLWTLDGKHKRKGMSLKNCPSCFNIVPSVAKVCPECGHLFTVEKPREEIEEVDGTLSERTSSLIIRQRDHYAACERERIERGYKPGWTAYRFKERFGTWPTRRVKSLATSYLLSLDCPVSASGEITPDSHSSTAARSGSE